MWWLNLLEKIFGEAAVQVIAQAFPVFLVAVLVTTAIISFAIAKLLSWKWGAVSVQKDAKISTLETMVKLRDDQLSNKFQSLPENEVKAMIEALEARLLKSGPRRLSSEQQADLIEAASFAHDEPKCTVHIVHDGVGGDSGLFAGEIMRAFSKARGWRVDAGMQIVTMDKYPDGGICLYVRDTANLTNQEQKAHDGLRAAGLKFEMWPEQHKLGNREDVELLVTQDFS